MCKNVFRMIQKCFGHASSSFRISFRLQGLRVRVEERMVQGLEASGLRFRVQGIRIEGLSFSLSRGEVGSRIKGAKG